MTTGKIELKLYRHKTYKDLYLKRTNFSGIGKHIERYEVTRDIFEAIMSCNLHPDFMEWLSIYPHSKVKAEFTKEIDLDGFKGRVKKEVYLSVSEFELVEFREVSE